MRLLGVDVRLYETGYLRFPVYSSWGWTAYDERPHLAPWVFLRLLYRALDLRFRRWVAGGR